MISYTTLHSCFSLGWLSSQAPHCSTVRLPALLKPPAWVSLNSPRNWPVLSMLYSARGTQDMIQSIQHLLPAVLLYTEGISLPQPTPQATEPTWTYLLSLVKQTCGEPPSPLQVSLFFSPPTQSQDGWRRKFFPLNLSCARNFSSQSFLATIGISTFFKVSLKKPRLSRFTNR